MPGRKPPPFSRVGISIRRYAQCGSGLQNPGIDVFMERDIPFLKKYDTKIIVNVCGKTVEDYVDVVERLGDEPAVSMLAIRN